MQTVCYLKSYLHWNFTNAIVHLNFIVIRSESKEYIGRIQEVPDSNDFIPENLARGTKRVFDTENYEFGLYEQQMTPMKISRDSSTIVEVPDIIEIHRRRPSVIVQTQQQKYSKVEKGISGLCFIQSIAS